jgi:hypothetical protein
MPSGTWQVWIADLKESRKLRPQVRKKVDLSLNRAIHATLQRYRRYFELEPQILLGDELQAVLTPDAHALSILTYLRAQLALGAGQKLALRAGLGLGPITHMDRKSPFASDGPAFHHARKALLAFKRPRSRRLTGWVTGLQAFDDLADALLPLIDSLARRWSSQQWQVVAMRLEGMTLETIGSKLQVSHQAVNKRLAAAAWNEAGAAIQYLDGLLEAEVRPGPVPAKGRAAQAAPRVRSMRSGLRSRSTGGLATQ